MKILLTGATGFIGREFARTALSSGHHIAGLVIPGEKIPLDLPNGGNVEWLKGTLDDVPWNEVKEFGPEVCIHTAWVTAPGIYLESDENIRFLESSVKFLRKVTQFGTNHIIGLGTCVEYQISNQPLSEEATPITPTTTYARCKNELRLRMEADARNGSFSNCWARIFYPYGPREHPARLCSSLIQKLSRGEKITLKTPNSTKDYIYISDLAEALLTIVEKRFVGTINIGSGIGVTVREIAQTLGRMMNRIDLIEEVEPTTDDPLGYVVANASRLKNLGWAPANNMPQGLRKMLDAQTQATKP